MPELCARFSRSPFAGCGGLIAAGNPALEHYPRIVVFGAGARDLRDLPDLGAADWDVRFVRGPETARALGLAPERWLCDPAALIPKVHGGRGRGRLLRAGPQRIAFAPGPVLTQATAATLADKAGLHLLRHDLPPEAWIDQLLDCDAAI
jgi:hypothetical protein